MLLQVTIQVQNVCPGSHALRLMDGQTSFLTTCLGFMIVTVPGVASPSSGEHEGWR